MVELEGLALARLAEHLCHGNRAKPHSRPARTDGAMNDSAISLLNRSHSIRRQAT